MALEISERSLERQMILDVGLPKLFHLLVVRVGF